MSETRESDIDRGDTKYAEVTFKNAAGTLTDPTTVVVHLQKPDGTISTFTYPTNSEVTKTSTGVFRFTFRLTSAGTYRGAMVGTGAVAQTGRWVWQVLEDPFTI